MEDVRRLQLRGKGWLGHLGPELAEDGVVEVVLAADLVGYTYEALDVLEGAGIGVSGVVRGFELLLLLFSSTSGPSPWVSPAGRSA